MRQRSTQSRQRRGRTHDGRICAVRPGFRSRASRRDIPAAIDDDGKWMVDVAFYCQAPLGEVRLSSESSSSAWVSIERMPPLAFAGELSAFEKFKQRSGSASGSADSGWTGDNR